MKLHNRCMGECCEDIGLRISPAALEKSYLKWRRMAFYKNLTEDVNGTLKDDKDVWDINEIFLLYPMLKYTGKNHKHPESSNKITKELYYHYTCVHFDSKSRRCGIYKIRPMMCRTYPNSGICRNPKCRWKKQIEARKKIKEEREY